MPGRHVQHSVDDDERQALQAEDSTPTTPRSSRRQTLSDGNSRSALESVRTRLRHWYGTPWVADGADLRTAQTLLRHAHLNTTAIYVEVLDPKRVEAIDRLNPF